MVRDKGLSFYSRKKKVSSGLFIEIITWIFGIVFAVFLAGVLVYFFGMTTRVVGESMEPTLYNEQTVFVDRFSYIFSTPKSGDVVVFLPNGNEKSHYYVKRVVAEPGDTLRMEDGVLYVNGLETQWPLDIILDPGIVEKELTLGRGEYFCIGDNPNNSEDSRSANIGPITSDDIYGKVWFHLKSAEDGIGFVKGR